MEEIKKYCQPGVYVPCFCFSCFYRSMYSIDDTQQTFWGFIFAEIPSKNTLISQLASLHSDLQNGWLLHMIFWRQQDSNVGRIWPLEVVFRPHLACMLLVQCWQPFSMLDLPSGEKGLDISGTIQLSGDYTLGFFFTGLSCAALKLRRI